MGISVLRKCDGAFAGSMRYSIKNASSATNASANFFAINDAGEGMRLGIRTTNHFLGRGAYIVNSSGQTIFGNAKKQKFVWNIDMTDSGNDYSHIVWPVMALVPQAGIASNAFLGIGTTNPASMLHVAGSATIDNILTANKLFRGNIGSYGVGELVTYDTVTNSMLIASNGFYTTTTNLQAQITTETNRAQVAEATLYPINNPSNYVTQVVTNGLAPISYVDGQVSALYPRSNPSNYVTQAVTNGLAPSSALASYYLASNPSNYVTQTITNGLVAQTSLTSQLGSYYLDSNPSNYVTKVVTNGLAPTSALSSYYLASNPSNYVTQTVTNGLASIVYVTNAITTATNGMAYTSQLSSYYLASNPSNYVTQTVTNGLATQTYVNSQIGVETNRAIQAENTISNALNIADTNLAQRITTETNRAQVAEAGLQTQINATTNRVKAIEDRTNIWNSAVVNASLNPDITEARLSLTTDAVCTTDVFNQATLYYVPYNGNRISLYDVGGAAWIRYTVAIVTNSLAALTTGKNYDVFAYANGGVVTNDFVVWTDDNNRATELAFQDGILVKSGSVDRKYVGTIRILTTGAACEDSTVRRFVWNYWNRKTAPAMRTTTTASWTYATASWRLANAVSSNIIEFVVGEAEDEMRASGVQTVLIASNGRYGSTAIGVNSTTVPSGRWTGGGGAATTLSTLTSDCHFVPLHGYNYIAWLEYASASITFYGTSTTTSSTKAGIATTCQH